MFDTMLTDEHDRPRTKKHVKRQKKASGSEWTSCLLLLAGIAQSAFVLMQKLPTPLVRETFQLFDYVCKYKKRSRLI